MWADIQCQLNKSIEQWRRTQHLGLIFPLRYLHEWNTLLINIEKSKLKKLTKQKRKVVSLMSFPTSLIQILNANACKPEGTIVNKAN